MYPVAQLQLLFAELYVAFVPFKFWQYVRSVTHSLTLLSKVNPFVQDWGEVETGATEFWDWVGIVGAQLYPCGHVDDVDFTETGVATSGETFWTIFLTGWLTGGVGVGVTFIEVVAMTAVEVLIKLSDEVVALIICTCGLGWDEENIPQENGFHHEAKATDGTMDSIAIVKIYFFIFIRVIDYSLNRTFFCW